MQPQNPNPPGTFHRRRPNTNLRRRLPLIYSSNERFVIRHTFQQIVDLNIQNFGLSIHVPRFHPYSRPNYSAMSESLSAQSPVQSINFQASNSAENKEDGDEGFFKRLVRKILKIFQKKD